MSSSDDSVSSEEIDIEGLRNASAFLSESSDENVEAGSDEGIQNDVENGSPEARTEDGVMLYLTPLNPDGSYRSDEEEDTPPITPPERGFRPISPTPTPVRSFLGDPPLGRRSLLNIRATLGPFPDPSGFDFSVLRNARPIRPITNFRPRTSGLTRFNFPTPTSTLSPRSDDANMTPSDVTPRQSSDEDNTAPSQTNVRARPRSPTPVRTTARGVRIRPAYPGLLRAREFVRPTQEIVLNSSRLSPMARRGYYTTSRAPRRAGFNFSGFNFASPTQTINVTPRLATPHYDFPNIPPGSSILRARVYHARRGSAAGPRVRGGRVLPTSNLHEDCSCEICQIQF